MGKLKNQDGFLKREEINKFLMTQMFKDFFF